MTRLESALLELAAFLDRSGWPYMLIGGLALAAWGEPRATLDIDLLVWVERERLDDALRAIAAQFGAPTDALELARRSRVLPVIAPGGVRADLVFAALPGERDFLRRAVTKRIGDADIRVASVEDLVFMKLVSDRPKDAEDARRLLRRFRHSIDSSRLELRLREIAEALGHPDILENFRRAIESAPPDR